LARLSVLFILFFSLTSTAQEVKKDTIPDGWKSNAQAELLISQSAFNNDWQGGGTSNVATNINYNHDLNFKKNKLNWDTKLIANLGLNATRGQRFIRKTSDRLELNSIAGSRIKESKWYWSGLFNFRTQFLPGYRFFEQEVTSAGTAVPEIEQQREKVTQFFSPAYLQIGPGVLWKKSNNLTINFAPVTSRFIFVSRNFTEVPQDEIEDFEPYFGVAANETVRFELGASLSVYYKEELFKNIVFENTLNLYADYLEKTQNVDLDYTLNVNMQVNEYITTNLAVQLIYDENAISGLQVRQVLGVGLKYSFLEWQSS
jgi:hypothetical protein